MASSAVYFLASKEATRRNSTTSILLKFVHRIGRLVMVFVSAFGSTLQLLGCGRTSTVHVVHVLDYGCGDAFFMLHFNCYVISWERITDPSFNHVTRI